MSLRYTTVHTSASARTRLAPRSARILVELVMAAIGIVLIVWAAIANQQWFDRHFLPAFFVSRQRYIAFESIGRVGAAVLGLTLAIGIRRRVGRFIERNPVLVFNTAAAVVLAVGVSELVLVQLHLHAAVQEPSGQEPKRRIDPRLGWTFVPSRAATHLESGRLVEYVFDSAGYRVRRLDEPVDFARPTILFTGESMMVGEGLTWDESVPAQVGTMLKVQSANIAVSAYATDQAYMRLRTELPRFEHPTAVVMLFSPALFDRNLDDDRPHLGPGLVWHEPEKRSRMLEILRLLVRYREIDTIDSGVAVTREVLRATIELARERGAVPLILVPQFAPEAPDERALRQRVLDNIDLPILRVELDGAWRFPGDGHPDARAAHALASAIAMRLRP